MCTIKDGVMEKFRGMTLNERLFSLNKFEAFDKAIKSNNIQQAIDILIKCELPSEEATKTVETILQNQKTYGF